MSLYPKNFGIIFYEQDKIQWLVYIYNMYEKKTLLNWVCH